MKEYSLGLYEKAMPKELSWKEKLEAAKEAGYDYVEISIDETEEKINRIYMSKEERLNMLQSMFETGIHVRSMCVSALTKYSLGNEDENMCSRGMEIIEKSIELADDLGIRLIMIPGYDVYYDKSTPETQRRFGKNLEKVVMMAASYGVLIELETMENNFMNTVWKAMYYVKKIESVYLGVYPDSGNIKNAAVALGGDEEEDIRSGKGHISSLHLKETMPGLFREVPYGTGHVDFEKVIRAAWDVGVRRYVTEFWYIGDNKWRDDLKAANTKMREILNRIQREHEEVVC
ncbi:L-ribulose-5-phosphate 3-epimerase [Aequitasia blattaphilus]|uniref:L-ribulose-5-phosphate 3-epimerase n=1 Tax=Aequitasia blattaphilus TaxID=2949332 RepID=A0ABT1EB39_9FIRM|nr:L-ribulose-5-phosphate 3-epimerase [Aequitasia blattaphilus]MCP1103050.1 L-ribulose-5-phosphate 3-epimerase [Aequitasia blattaphilus]MCR8615690.1 L-ribulose-5-phosphate 3-epimerase [Aequitasia blattaphilus]